MKRDEAPLKASGKSVQAFREATRALSTPPLELFTGLLATEDAPLVNLGLPLVNFSPLPVLPLELPATQEAAPASQAYDNTARRNPVSSAATLHPRSGTGAAEPRSPNRPGDFSSNAQPRTASHTHGRVSPVLHADRPAIAHHQSFSLKPRRASTSPNEFHESPTPEKGGSRSKSQSEIGKSVSSSSHGGGAVFAATKLDAGKEEREAFGENASPASHNGVNLHPARNHTSSPSPVLDALVASALQAIEERQTRRAINNHDAPDDVRRSLLDNPHQSPTESSSRLSAGSRSAPHNARQPDGNTKSRATIDFSRPRPASRAATSINLIDALADRLLRNARAANAGLSPAGAKNSTGRAALRDTQSDSVASSALTNGHAAMLPARQSDSSRSPEASSAQHRVAAESVRGETTMDEGTSAAESLSQQRINAQRLASIVNDVLTEQARLHGVDLS